ncbi:MAG: glycosyl hydrolase [Alteromonadaceae bacterium]|nr:MAG: glycosyl hydrolase [Alteromonadaceae bacterium]
MQNHSDISTRVEQLLNKMTLEEKLGQLMQLAANDPKSLELLETYHVGSYLHVSPKVAEHLQLRAAKTRLGIPLIFGSDAIHGHCFENNTVVFPTQLAMACTWNKNLVRKMGEITAYEMRQCLLHWAFSPVLCVARDPRWGRCGETFGEDAWLCGELAAELMLGLQGDGSQEYVEPNHVLACAKHFVAYGEAIGARDAYEAGVTKRRLLETFLPPFEKLIKTHKLASLMVAYQAIDGVACSASSWLLNDICRDEWGFEGIVLTDWNNIGALHTIQNRASSYKEASKIGFESGNDVFMATPEAFEKTLELVTEGALDEGIIHRSAYRVLYRKFALGLFDQEAKLTEGWQDKLGAPDSWHYSLQASRQSLVLLKNTADLLPLDKCATNNILLVGPNADDVFAQLGDWSFGSKQALHTKDTLHKADTVNLKTALSLHCEAQALGFRYIKGADCIDSNFDEIALAREAAKSSDLIIACVGDTLDQHGEFHDRSDLTLSGKQQALLEAMKASGKTLIVVLLCSKPHAIPWVKDNADAVICAFNPGPKGGQAIKELVFGEISPEGRLPISFPYSTGQLPVYYNKYKGWHAFHSPQTEGQERYIDAPEAPLFAFGEGLSYTTIEYSELKLKNAALPHGQDLEFTVDIKNTGLRAGVEVVQVYLHDVYSSVTTPEKNLKAFERVELDASESKTILFTLPFDCLSLVNEALERVVEPGEFELMVGASSKDEDLLKVSFEVS